MGDKQKDSVTMFCFGYIENPENGYHLRCRLIYDLFSKQASSFRLVEFGDRESKNPIAEKNGTYWIKVLGSPKWIRNIMERLLTFDPLHVVFFQVQTLFSSVRNYKHIKQSTKVLIEGGLLIWPFLMAKLMGKHVVFDTHAINIDIAQKIAQKNKVSGYSRMVLWYIIEWPLMKLSNEIIVVGQRDKDIVAEKFGKKRDVITVIENPSGLRHGDYTASVIELKKMYKHAGTKIVTFVGDLGAIHNLYAANYILKQLAPKFDGLNVTFLIVGKNAKKIKSSKNVIFTGFVDSLEPYIELSDVCIAPLEVGGGVKTKVLDYISFNKVVLSTEAGIEGIPRSKLKNTHVSDIDDFKDKLKHLLNA